MTNPKLDNKGMAANWPQEPFLSLYSPVPHHGAYCAEITSETDLQAMEQPWRELFSNASYPTPFACWDWVWAWWQYFGRVSDGSASSSHLLVLAIYDDSDRLIGLVPLYAQSLQGARMRPRVLRLLGDRDLGAESATEEPSLIFRRGQEQEAILALITYLEEKRSSPLWDRFTLRFPYRDNSENAGRATGMAGLKCVLARHKVLYSELLSLPDTWETYRSSRSKSLRDNMAYYPRLLTRHGYEWTIRNATSSAEVAAATDTLFDLHSRRASSLRGEPHLNHLPTQTHRAFLKHCLPQLAMQGMIFILLLEIRGVAVAAQAFLESGGMMTVYYSGFDPDYYAYSPLAILNAEAIKRAIGSGIHCVNFLSGNADWKARWGTKPVPAFEQIVALRLSPPSLLRASYRLIERQFT